MFVGLQQRASKRLNLVSGGLQLPSSATNFFSRAAPWRMSQKSLQRLWLCIVNRCFVSAWECFSDTILSKKRIIDWIMVPKGGPPMQADPLLSERDGAAPTSSEPSALRRGYSGLNRHWPTVTRLLSFHSNCISSVKQDAEEVRSQIFRTSRGVTGDQTFKTNVAQKKRKKKASDDFNSASQLSKRINTDVCSLSRGLEW